MHHKNTKLIIRKQLKSPNPLVASIYIVIPVKIAFARFSLVTISATEVCCKYGQVRTIYIAIIIKISITGSGIIILLGR